MKVLLYIFLLLLLFSCKKTKGSAQDRTNIYYDRAFTFLDIDKDSAFINFEKARQDFQKFDDSLNVGKCYTQMAIIQCKNGDYFGSEETSVNAIKFLKHKTNESKDVLAANFNNLGLVSLSLKNYNRALYFFNSSRNISIDPQNRLIALNNVALSLQNLKEYRQAIRLYRKLSLLSKGDDKSNSAILTNLAFTKFLQNPNYNAEPELVSALNTRKKINDLWGQNASHAHLSDFYEKKDKKKSLIHAHEMYKIAAELNSPDDKLEALQKLVLLESPENSHKYFKIYQKLNDSLQIARAKAKNQFAYIRYETEKNKADLLSAQAENGKKENRLIFTYIFAFLLLATLVVGFFWYKKRKVRLEQQRELEVKNTALNYSKKVHDVVANGLYQTMVEVQNQDGIDKNKVLDKLEDLYEKSRDISKESGINTLNFNQILFEKLNAYSSSETKVFIVGNNPEIWDNVSEKIRKELLNILQELMVNMKKHSNAKQVSIKFEKVDNILKIRYLDNGMGIDFNSFQKGDGMQNMENRMEDIGGSINFEKNPAGGLVANISLPTNYV